MRTPKAGPAPRLNGPELTAVRAGHEFIYRIPATGNRPMRFSAKGLPPSIQLDPATGILRGKAPEREGEHRIALRAENSAGHDERTLKLVVGRTLALTPPMGWNHWYTHYDRITQAEMERSARQLVDTGMADYGYQYVSIDDCWMVKPGSNDPEVGGPTRDSAGNILTNKRFPDIKGMVDRIHGLGLRAGTYTSPGPLTCTKFEGAYNHEEQDARQIAAWGFDLLKYDWCSYRRIDPAETLEARKKPYVLMGAILERQNRDILLNLCQYGMSEVWKWGGEVGGHSWRTTGDLGLEKSARLPGFYSIAFKNMVLSDYAGPGRWNDPDYILIGTVGNAFKTGAPPQKTSLTADEQYSYMSLWSLMASPLFYSGDMKFLDEFTLNVLCNREVIAINQDRLGKQARVVRKTEDELVLLKPLANGGVAVGLFNLSEQKRTVTASWAELGLSGARKNRDPWRYRDRGTARGLVSLELPRHGGEITVLQ
ncbi:MAG: alpha-galactosidase [Candidatus Solibacter usitatus]|nr:alpha-galactosidase [Candidatus Solibacter usitatus]